MAKRLKWSSSAKAEFFAILKFWVNHNQSKTYSERLRKRVREVLHLACENPHIGKASSTPLIRVTLCDNYLIFYEILPEEIYVIHIRDGRMNPTQFRNR